MTPVPLAPPVALVTATRLGGTVSGIENLAGLRVGLGFAWVCLVVGEMTGVGTGLGSAIADARELFRIDLIMVGMILIGLIGYLSDRLVVHAFRRALRWSPNLFR